MTAATRALVARLRAELQELERVKTRVEELLAKARKTGDRDYLDGVALNLHGFYAGVERMFEMIAREVDESLPAGPEWHRDLLFQMAGEVPGVRPAVVRPQTRRCLDEYRGFRHVVRNVYAFNLHPDRIEALAGGMAVCFRQLSEDLERFCDVLSKG